MISFAERSHNPVFDWNKFLASEPTATEWAVARDWANNWVTCACGNQCAALPRYTDGKPHDPELSRLGMDFYDAIGDFDRPDARRILQAIEARAIELLAAL